VRGTYGVHGFGTTVRRFYIINGQYRLSCLSCTKRTSHDCRICRRIEFLVHQVTPFVFQIRGSCVYIPSGPRLFDADGGGFRDDFFRLPIVQNKWGGMNAESGWVQEWKPRLLGFVLRRCFDHHQAQDSPQERRAALKRLIQSKL
jgi:hypothetical protein